MPLPLIAWGAIAASAAVVSAVGGYAAYESGTSSSSSSSNNSRRNEQERERAKAKLEGEQQKKKFEVNAEAVKKFVSSVYGEDRAKDLNGIEDLQAFKKTFEWICTEKLPPNLHEYNAQLARLRQRKRKLSAAVSVLNKLQENE